MGQQPGTTIRPNPLAGISEIPVYSAPILSCYQMNKILIAAACMAVTTAVEAQTNPSLTAQDYARAESMLSYNTEALIDRSTIVPNWMPGGKFWYRVLTAQGSEFILVDPAKGVRAPAFNHEKLAAAIAKATGKPCTASMLPFMSFNFSADGKAIVFSSRGKHWKCDLQQYNCEADNNTPVIANNNALPYNRRNPAPGNEVVSPDGKKAAFIKEHNLWVRDLASNQQTQLTTDGVQDLGYATDNAGWSSSDKPVLRWSHDSKKIATFRQDERNVNSMYLVTTNVGAPTLQAWKYPLPGDSTIITIQRVIIDVENPKVINIQVAPDAHRGTLSDDISSSGTFDDVDWSDDNTQLAFVSTSRDHKEEKLRIADAATGAVREVLEEKVATQYESGQGAINWRYLKKSNEIIWYSERDNWGHLYLYDAATGKLKNQVTKGDWVVTKLIKVDEKNRELYFIADGREAGNPYFSHFYKIGFNGQHLTLLTPEEGNHQVTLSPDNNYFIDSYSQPNIPPVTVLRKMDGKLVTNLEKADLSRLTATGWHAAKPFSVKAHDGKTDIYGLLYTPSNLDPQKKYPIIDYIYPGPQGGSVGGNWSFVASRIDHQALAELGFVVMVLEGTSNPLRSKSFHDMSYGNMAENTLPDQVGGIRQLAAQYSYIDTSRIGIWGHSGGGFATACAMFRYPDFFKVGISESGNHDNRNYEDDWGERYNGLAANSDYNAQANQNYAANLKGKLLLAHGMMDNNVPPYNTLLVVEALEKANKDYDLIIFPNSKHGYGAYTYYMMRRRWDYFVRNLLHAEPPKEYDLKMKMDPRNSFGTRD